MGKIKSYLGPLLILPLIVSVPALAAKSKLPVIQEPEPTVQTDKTQNQQVPATPGQAQPVKPKSAAPNFDLNWFTINGGGDSYGSSANYRLGYSIGQSVAGEGGSASYNLGIGFWYGAEVICIAIPGDANASGTYTLGDILAVVNYYFNKPGCSPQPLCWLSGLLCRGDWNGSGTITLGDIIQGVNYYFNKPGGPWNAFPSGVCCLTP